MTKKCIEIDLKGEYKIITGIVASGDVFCSSIEQKNEIRREFKADCVEMEGAAIAQVCKLSKLPFIVIRSISDKPDGSNHIEFEKFLKLASKRCANLLKNII